MNLPSTCGAIASTSMPCVSQKLPRIFDVVDPRGFDLDLLESRRSKFAAILLIFQRSGHAAHPQASRSGASRRDLAPYHNSETAKRPPGFSTRNASRNTRSLSAERLITQLEMITSTELSGSGMFSISPLRNSTFSTPALRLFSRPAPASHPSCPGRRPCRSAPLAGRKQHVNAAARAQIEHSFSRIQLRQRRRIAAAQRSQRASAGIWLVCAASYRFDVIGSQQPSSAADAPQQQLPPVVTRSAACPYFSFTISLILPCS